MKILEASENYLETIYMLQKTLVHVRSVDIANKLGYSKPTISAQMKKFRTNGYIVVDGDGYITLTEKGLEIAKEMYERHEILAQMLIHLGVAEETAYEDSCRIEHVLSAESYNCIKHHFFQHRKDKSQ